MTGYPIRYDIPLPPVRTGRTKGSPGQRYPFNSMRVGGAFPVSPAELNLVRQCAASWSRKHPGWKFTVRKLPDGQPMVWCLARPDSAVDLTRACGEELRGLA